MRSIERIVWITVSVLLVSAAGFFYTVNSSNERSLGACMLDQAFLFSAVDSFMEQEDYDVVESIAEKHLTHYHLMFTPNSWAHKNISDKDLTSLVNRELSQLGRSHYKGAFCEYRDNRLEICE